MENLTFEDRIALLVMARTPQEKTNLLNQFLNNKEFFTNYNAKELPLAQYMELNKEAFAHIAVEAKMIRDGMRHKGWTDKKYQRMIGHLPDKLLLERKEFAATLSRRERDANIRRFLELYPAFKVNA